MENKQSILVVEDEAVIAADIAESLKGFGYNVAGVVPTGEEAINVASTRKPDLVLMDIKLAGNLDGIDTAALIRQERKVPVVYLTAYADAGTLKRAKVTEPYGYLTKPHKELDLATTIDIALHRSSVEQGELPDEEESVSGQAPQSGEALAIYDFLRQVWPFSKMPASDVVKLAHAARSRKYSQGEFVTIEGDEASSGFIVVDGRVAVIKASASGKELIVELLPPGDPFGLLSSINKQPYPYSTRAQIPTTLLWIPRNKITSILDQQPEIGRQFINEVFDRLRNSHDLARMLAHDRVEVRVAFALRALMPRLSGRDENNVPLTRHELADLVGTSEETCIRITKAMERRKILDLSVPKSIRVVDSAALEGIADGLGDRFE
jgi:CRP-like cAMP-binding protein/CheY-like chemotaxis protein